MEAPKPKARVRAEYKVQYQNPIQVKAGQSVRVGRADHDYLSWLWCCAADGREGWIHLELIAGEGPIATVLRDYSAKELPVRPGDEVEV
jgi:SH3-like domain-containing protein